MFSILKLWIYLKNGLFKSRKEKLDNLTQLHKSSSATIIFPQVGIYLDVYEEDIHRASSNLEEVHI